MPNVISVFPGSKKLGATAFSNSTITAAQISDSYGVPVPFLNQAGSGFEFNLSGTIVQAGTTQNIVFTTSNQWGQANSFPSVTLLAAAFAISTTYVYSYRMRWWCTGFNTGVYEQQVITSATGVAGTPIVYASNGAWNIHFQGAGGNGNNMDNFNKAFDIQPVFVNANVGVVGPTVTGLASSMEAIVSGPF